MARIHTVARLAMITAYVANAYVALCIVGRLHIVCFFTLF